MRSVGGSSCPGRLLLVRCRRPSRSVPSPGPLLREAATARTRLNHHTVGRGRARPPTSHHLGHVVDGKHDWHSEWTRHRRLLGVEAEPMAFSVPGGRRTRGGLAQDGAASADDGVLHAIAAAPPHKDPGKRTLTGTPETDPNGSHHQKPLGCPVSRMAGGGATCRRTVVEYLVIIRSRWAR